jgi:poly-gamma-glutamate synthesis protein (capsule biosynthesis protein)
MKYFIPSLLALSLIVLSVKSDWRTNALTTMGLTASPSQEQVQEPVLPITLTLVGDIMMDRGVKKSVIATFDGDYAALFKNTAYLKESDITFANLEGSVATGGRNVGSRFSFHMDPKSLLALKGAGIDIVSFANNHVGDYATEGFLESLTHLQENNILYAGAGSNRAGVTTPTIITIRGTKIGFLATTDVGPNWLAATDTKAGILLASDPQLPVIIAAAKKSVDILVVSFHFGNEYSPSNTHQEKLTHSAIDAGADIVVGHHPHVMERVELYQGKPIFYSLGNFIFDQYFSVHTMRGMVAHVSIDPITKAITTTQEVSTQSRQFIPQAPIPFDPSMLITKTFTP